MIDDMKRSLLPESGTAVLKLKRGERLTLVGFAVVHVTRGRLWVQGVSLEPGQEALLRSWPEAGSTVVLEALPDGSGCEAELREVERPAGTPAPRAARPLPGPCRAPPGAQAGFVLHPCDSPAAGVATELPDEWRAACRELRAAAAAGGRVVVLVCGPKGVGKSTLVRLVVNSLLQAAAEVQLLDGDCGQPELSPPGLLALATLRAPLLGPPALRAACSDAPEPAALRFVGEESPAADPDGFAAALHSLLAEAQAQQPPGGGRRAPLVINTQGWVRGLGRELLDQLAAAATPTHVLQLGAAASVGGLPPAPFWLLPAPLPRVALLQPAPRAAAAGGARGAADLRALLWAAWAHRAAAAASPAGIGAVSDAAWAQLWAPGAEGEAGALAAAAEALCAAPPMRAPLAALCLLRAGGEQPAADALRALNGAVVGLAGEAGTCLGLALVRSVDTAALYLLSPLALPAAAAARGLLLGRLALPAKLLRGPGALHSPYLTPLALAQEGSGGGAMRSRGNLQRASSGRQTDA